MATNFLFRQSKTNPSRYTTSLADDDMPVGSVIGHSVTTSSPRSGVDNLKLWTAKTVMGKILGTQYPTRQAAAEALATFRQNNI